MTHNSSHLHAKKKGFLELHTSSHLHNTPCLHNYGTLYKYGSKYKLTCLATYRQVGFELGNFIAKGEAGNDEKLCNSLSRTKARIFELAYCNTWKYFVTFTLDKNKYNRHDLPKFIKDLGQLIRDKRKKYCTDIRYLLIPERHNDGAWHLHGFFIGIPENELREFTLQERLPDKIRKRIADGKRVFTWTSYERQFGFSDIELVENHEAVSKYICKYVTKEAMHTITELNAHCFYASKGLQGKEAIANGFVNPFEPDYFNEYCSAKWFDAPEEALCYFKGGDCI